jgi:hypothetical protein
MVRRSDAAGTLFIQGNSKADFQTKPHRSGHWYAIVPASTMGRAVGACHRDTGDKGEDVRACLSRTMKVVWPHTASSDRYQFILYLG